MSNLNSFVISLKQYPQKYQRTIANLSPLSLALQREDAVYGKDLDAGYVKEITYPSVQYTMKHGRLVDSNIFTIGAIGCYLSHTNLWKRLVEEKGADNQTYLIFEDDIGPLRKETTISHINEFINELNRMSPNWDVAMLGWMKPLPGVKDADQDMTKNIVKVNDITFGLHAYLIRKKGARKLLEKAFPIVDQLDSYLSYRAARGDVEVYRSRKPFFYQANIEGSSIQENFYKNIKPFVNRFSNGALIGYILFSLILILAIACLIYKIFRK